jgi:hypothetical protein
MLLNSLLPHHDSKSNGLKSEIKRNKCVRLEVFTSVSLRIKVFQVVSLGVSPHPFKTKKTGSPTASENTSSGRQHHISNDKDPQK